MLMYSLTIVDLFVLSTKCLLTKCLSTKFLSIKCLSTKCLVHQMSCQPNVCRSNVYRPKDAVPYEVGSIMMTSQCWRKNSFLFAGEILTSLPRFVGENKLALLRKTGQPAVLAGKARSVFRLSSFEQILQNLFFP